ncbi:MAG: type II secretion system F family protein [Fuerstia sp.]|nr:type II secretion system F family protein [Fuerstiella sp.]
MTFIQMWLFMTNRSEPLRQASLLMLLAGGVGHGDTLLQSLRAHEQESKSIWASKIGQLRMLLEHGHSLSGALSIISQLLPDQTVTAIRVAEGTGALADVLMDEARRLHQQSQSKSLASGTLEQDLLWAAALTTIATSIVWFLFVFIVPKFKEIFIGFGVEMPASTIAMIEVSDFVFSYWFIFILPVTATVFVFDWLVYSSMWRKLTHGYPRFAELWPRYWLPGILRTLSLSAASGQPLGRGLDCVMQDLPPGRSAKVVSALRHRVNGGEDAIVAMQSVGLLRTSEAAFLHSSLKTHHLDWGLRHLADTVERRRRNLFRRLSQFIGPGVVLFVGALVMLLARAFFEPLIKLLNDLS